MQTNENQIRELDVRFPHKLSFLSEPARYKVAYGGRGSAKSWSFARQLLIDGLNRRERVLCTREVQKSIKDSVHKLLSDQIQLMGMGQYYDVQNAIIRGRNGTEFLFAGLSDQTAESIKSFEGVTKCWVEEAQALSDRSWKILIPTIRAEGSEIWITFNPELDTDPTWVRFVENTPPDTAIARINYHDNPWFPSVLEGERIHDELILPKHEYENIWEGKCLPAIHGAIYAEEIAKAQEEGRITQVPYDPDLKVHCIFDMGWNDKMAIIMVQRHMSALKIVDYLEDDHKTLDWYSNRLKDKDYNWGYAWLPHDGRHRNHQTGRSDEEILTDLGWEVRIVPDHGRETGIRNARRGFAQTYFNKARTMRLVECLKRYRRGVPATTGEPGAPMHDEWSHGADCFRYLHVVAPDLENTKEWEPLPYEVDTSYVL